MKRTTDSALFVQTEFTPQRWMFATLAWKHYLREPYLLARTTKQHLRTTNFRLLHFISLIRSPLASLSLFLPLHLFLSKMDNSPRGMIRNKGLKRKTLLFPLPVLLNPLSLHPSFRLVLFMERFSCFLKDSHLLWFFPSVPSPITIFFLNGQQYAMEVVSPEHMNRVTAKESLCYELNSSLKREESFLLALTLAHQRVCLLYLILS